MLVLVGPPFSGSEDEFAKLSAATQLLVYELKTKLKPDTWGVVKVLADQAQAEALATKLRDAGFRVALVDQGIASDPGRMFVQVRAIELLEADLVLHLSERSMTIPYRAMTTIVRGEVGGFRRSPSSSGFRAVVPTRAEVEVFRESASTDQGDAYAAADIHFATVLWVARIDARAFDFSVLGARAGAAEGLDRLVELLSQRANVRVDRGSKTSNVVGFAPGGARRAPTPLPVPGQPPMARREAPERFDIYSRLIGEAERQAARPTRTIPPPPP